MRGRLVILLQPNDEGCEVMRRFSNVLPQLHVVDNVFILHISEPLLDITYTAVEYISHTNCYILNNIFNFFIF